jgi:hypothetical protein
MTIRNYGNNPGIAPSDAVVFCKGCAVAALVAVLFAAADDNDDDEEGVFGTPHVT